MVRGVTVTCRVADAPWSHRSSWSHRCNVGSQNLVESYVLRGVTLGRLGPECPRTSRLGPERPREALETPPGSSRDDPGRPRAIEKCARVAPRHLFRPVLSDIRLRKGPGAFSNDFGIQLVYRLDDTRFLLLQSLFYQHKSNISQNKTASRLDDTQIRLRRCAYHRSEKHVLSSKLQYYYASKRIGNI